jgi:hypothetical protein
MNLKSRMGFDSNYHCSFTAADGEYAFGYTVSVQTPTGPEYGCGSLRLDWLTGSRVFEVQLIGFRGACVGWCIYREGGCCLEGFLIPLLFLLLVISRGFWCQVIDNVDTKDKSI